MGGGRRACRCRGRATVTAATGPNTWTSIRSTTSVPLEMAWSTCCRGIPLYSPYTTACSSSRPCMREGQRTQGWCVCVCVRYVACAGCVSCRWGPSWPLGRRRWAGACVPSVAEASLRRAATAPGPPRRACAPVAPSLRKSACSRKSSPCPPPRRGAWLCSQRMCRVGGISPCTTSPFRGVEGRLGGCDSPAAAAHLDVAVTTKYRSGRSSFSLLMTASLPTPLGPLMMTTQGF